MIKVHREKMIEGCPYGAMYFVPPYYPHKSTFFKISLICDGESDIDFYSRTGGKNKRMRLKRGDAFIITPQDVHHFIGSGWTNYCFRDVYIMEDRMKRLCDNISDTLYDEITSAEYPPVFKVTLNTLFSLVEMHSLIAFKQTSKSNDAIHNVLVTYLLGKYLEYGSEKRAYPKWLKKFLEDMEKEDFLTLSIEEMVKSVNYSHSYVCREFKKYLKVPIKQYIIKRKLVYSCNMLTQTDQSLDEISMRFNFSSLSNYIFLFKREYGVTPGKYRKEHQIS